MKNPKNRKEKSKKSKRKNQKKEKKEENPKNIRKRKIKKKGKKEEKRKRKKNLFPIVLDKICVCCLYPIPDSQQYVKRGNCRRQFLSGLLCFFWVSNFVCLPRLFILSSL